MSQPFDDPMFDRFHAGAVAGRAKPIGPASRNAVGFGLKALRRAAFESLPDDCHAVGWVNGRVGIAMKYDGPRGGPAWRAIGLATGHGREGGRHIFFAAPAGRPEWAPTALNRSGPGHDLGIHRGFCGDRSKPTSAKGRNLQAVSCPVRGPLFCPAHRERQSIAGCPNRREHCAGNRVQIKWQCVTQGSARAVP